jgi:hypothetical protein
MHSQIGPHLGDTVERKVRCVEAEPVRELAGLRQEQEGEAELGGGGGNGAVAAQLRRCCYCEARRSGSRRWRAFWRGEGVVGPAGEPPVGRRRRTVFTRWPSPKRGRGAARAGARVSARLEQAGLRTGPRSEARGPLRRKRHFLFYF